MQWLSEIFCKRRARQEDSRWTQEPQEASFEDEGTISVGGWTGTERRGCVAKPWKSDCRFYQLANLLPPEGVDKLLQHVKTSAAYEDYLDSIDHQPVFEFYLVSNGNWQDSAMKQVLEPFVEGRLLPYVRKTYKCPTIALDQVLVRRYVPGERRTLGVHFDVHSYVTAVLGLNDPSEYTGGLYLQPEAHASSRRFFRIQPGDVVFHSFDLEHGVFVWEGVRYSVIFWLKDSEEAVATNTSPWYDRLIDHDDPACIYNCAQDYEHGIFGRPQNLPRAMQLYQRSATLGHHFAQYRLGLLLHTAYEETHRKEDLTEGLSWLRKAAKQGFAPAQRTYALIFAGGAGVPQDYETAVEWMRAAADQLDHEAANYMGEFYMQGYGVQPDSKKAAEWYTTSASAGLPEAQCTLGLLYAKGRGVKKDEGECFKWLRLAAANGNKKARKKLLEFGQSPPS
eukprot:TRINITY_DN68536_c0_g1_i1.p1 TRINITY_DN68536_c0_g1~~TRINITY_DN68536_c0_g1_i1.p1  ORF type:complete len:451 (+),score=70.81 TRINITY_DN68536_c0_g1_i1:49-1401(+)